VAPSLEALIEAGILSSIPLDPFADGPLRYSAERRLLWSHGPEGAQTGEGPAFGELGGLEDWIWPTPGD
jgi:hypothetical protein